MRQGTCSIMRYFHGQDQSCCSSEQAKDRFPEAAPSSPSGTFLYWMLPFACFGSHQFCTFSEASKVSGTESYSGSHPTEPPIKFHEEGRIGGAMPIVDENEINTEVCMIEVCIDVALLLVDLLISTNIMLKGSYVTYDA